MLLNDPIPFLDLKAQYTGIAAELQSAVQEVLESAQYVLGPRVAAFEDAFAAYCGTRHAVAVNSGTSALHLALLANGIGPGDEVLTVPMTFVATVAAIIYAGATPRFVDIDPRTWTMDPAKIEGAITPRTRAIMPVHLHGRLADMAPINAIAKSKRLVVIEDAAQAHGAARRRLPCGSVRRRRLLQLLSGQEPRRLRRGRGDRHQQRGHRGAGPHPARLGAARALPSCPQGLQLPDGRDPGRDPVGEAREAGRLD